MRNEQLLVRILIELIVIIGLARIASYVSRRLAQPIVVGEIMAGLILGPSFLGHFVPKLFTQLFPSSTTQIIYQLSQVGLIFLMFMIGIEFDFGNVKKHGRHAAAVSVTGILVPFILGGGLGIWMHRFFPQTNGVGFPLFVATAMSITAIPILGRIMIEFNLHRTDVGVLTITAAAIDDALGWICLAVVSMIVASKVNVASMAVMVALVLLYAIIILKIVRPLAIRFFDKQLRENGGDLNLTSLAVVITGILCGALATNLIGISSLFGPFMLGAAFYDQEELKEAVFKRLKDFITVFFLPIFFTYTGLHTDMGSITTPVMWLSLGLLVFFSFFGKLVGCYLAARFSGLQHRQAAIVGVMMNTRALMGLIAANIGMEMGAITSEVYCMLVLMCVLSTIAASPLLTRLIPGTELHEPFLDSDYVSARTKMGLKTKAAAGLAEML